MGWQLDTSTNFLCPFALLDPLSSFRVILTWYCQTSTESITKLSVITRAFTMFTWKRMKQQEGNHFIVKKQRQRQKTINIF